MIKLIIIDLSDVCFSCEEEPFLRKFAAEHNLDYEELDDFYQELLLKSEADEITGEELWQRLLTAELLSRLAPLFQPLFE